MFSAFLRSKQGRLMSAVLAVTLITLNLAPAAASSANISHSYKADAQIADGSLVSLDPGRSDYVQLANSGNAARLIGVAVDSNDSLLAVDSSSGTAQIATSGSAAVLVSTVDGDIGLGDPIGVSPFNGVGMKAGPGSEIIGLAQTTLDSHTQGIVDRTVTNKDGKNSQIKVGLVRVNIAIGTIGGPAQTEDEQLSGLQRLAKSITGHKVSTARVLVSLVVAVVSLMALITLIYASIYGSIVSIGRNPLAKYAIFRTLGSVLALAVLTTVVTGLTLFLLLR
jgi:hypothetical protein